MSLLLRPAHYGIGYKCLIIIVTEGLPRDMPIPNWLSGIIGIRLIILIPEVYTILAKPLGWKKFPLSIEKILKSIG